MKKILIFLLPILVFAILVFSFLIWWTENTLPVSSEKALKDFIIPRGYGASLIGRELEKEGLIKSALAFKIYVQIYGKGGKIQAGEYRLSPSDSLQGILDRLLKGPQEIWVTIPEGLRREEIADKFIETLGLKGDTAVKFRQDFLLASKDKEGRLFPDTYLFPRDVQAAKVVDRLLSTFDNRLETINPNNFAKTGLDLAKTVVLASLVERETKTNEERPIVAGILLKRMKNDWPLEVDASLQYVLANTNCQATNAKCEWWSTVHAQDKEIRSPYNLYKNLGLPPTAIANPGLSSLKAAIFPEDSPYWFYLHDTNGQIHYAKTLEEHNQNIARYLSN